jgi:hypothetical protein
MEENNVTEEEQQEEGQKYEGGDIPPAPAREGDNERREPGETPAEPAQPMPDTTPPA